MINSYESYFGSWRYVGHPIAGNGTFAILIVGKHDSAHQSLTAQFRNWQSPILNSLRDRFISAAQQISKMRIGSECFQMGIDAHERKADGMFSLRLR